MLYTNTIMISVKELRERFEEVRTGLANGKQYILLYRSKPIAELHPFRQLSQGSTRAEDAKRVAALAGGFQLGQQSPEELNADYDESYEDMLPRR